MRKKKSSLIIVIILLVLFLGLGYAYLTTTLNINGTTDVDSNTWNIYWDNVQVTSGSVTGTQVTQMPTIDTNKTTVSFQIRLKEPGEYYEFTVDATNDGTIDAMIDTITKTNNIPDYLYYIVTYEDGIEIEQNQLLKANTTEKYKVRVEYRTNINPNQLPSTAQSLNLSFSVTYIQADANSSPPRITLFTYNNSLPIGQSITSQEPTYNTYQEVMAAKGFPMFLKHVVSNNVPLKVYLGFEHNGRDYYIQPDPEGMYYESNKQILKEAFGEEYCSERSDSYYPLSYTCVYPPGDYTIAVHARINGTVEAYSGGQCCYIYGEYYGSTYLGGCGMSS